MAEEQVEFELVTPERLLVSRGVEMVVVPGEDGDFGVLPRHTPMISNVRPGVLGIYEGGKLAESIFVAGGFAELHYKSDLGPTILASVRHDDPNEERGDTTSKLGFIYDFRNGQTSISGNWGQGFSLPGFFALASPLVGNPNLRPETSESYDLGVTHWSADKRIGVTLTLFHNEFTDLIDFDGATFSMVNRDRLDTEGIEMQLDYSASEQLSLHVQATYMDLEFRNTTIPVLHRPEWRGGVSMRWAPTDKWLLDASWLNVG
jgi:F0F1-type ATP synthase epsilon subunit